MMARPKVTDRKNNIHSTKVRSKEYEVDAGREQARVLEGFGAF